MIDFGTYSKILKTQGRNLSEVRKNQSDDIMDITFMEDVGYKKVYLLSPTEGWKYVDAKYSKHAVSSISKDKVDRYLQFRPKEHYPIGTYVYIPDDTEFDLSFDDNKNPLESEIQDHLWLIVERNDATQFVRYLVLKCNWNFKWISDFGEGRHIFNCWGCVRNANSYTSGIWTDFRITALDNITNAWLPNTFLLYGENMSRYGLSDTRSLKIQERIMISLNVINPNCYMISKIGEMTPQGIIKLTLKQDDYNPKRDNPSLMLCDYYNDTGDIIADQVILEDDIENPPTIIKMVVDANNELNVGSPVFEPLVIDIGETYYLRAVFNESNTEAHWRIVLIDNENNYSESDVIALEKLITIRNVDKTTISLKPAKAQKAKGLHYHLIVSNIEGNQFSEIELEVNQ